MKAHRLWIEIAILGASAACALALLIATLGVAAAAAVGSAGPQQTAPPTAEQTYEGIVTCSRCGAKHSANIGKTAADCVRVCVHGGATFALVNGDSTYLLDGDWTVLKRAAGQRVRIVGAVSGRTITVSSVAAGS